MSNTIIAAKLIRVRTRNFREEKWDVQQINRDAVTSQTIFTDRTDHVRLVCGPDNHTDPRLKTGAVFLSLPTSADKTLRRVRLRKGGYSETLIADLRELKFSTFIENNIDQSAPGLVLQIDNNGDLQRNFNIFFTPRDQRVHNNAFPAVQQNSWQEWDTIGGLWNSEPPLPEFPNGFTLLRLTSHPKYANARIVDTQGGGHEGFGIRLTVGAEDPTFKDFRGYVDAVTIQAVKDNKPVIFDFVCDIHV